MIVSHFQHWMKTAPPVARADATAALARSYLAGEMADEERDATRAALLALLDDPAEEVRAALAVEFAASADAPTEIVLALAADAPGIAACVLEHSPLLLDIDLVDAVGGGDAMVQASIARRRTLCAPVAAAIAEVGSAESCLILIENAGAEIAAFSLERIVERFGHLAAVRQGLLMRDDVSPATRQSLIVKLAGTLADFAVAQQWMAEARARTAAREACERSTVALAAGTDIAELPGLVRHLRESGQLNAGLVLRALLSGQSALFEAALADLSGLSLSRVGALVHDRSGHGLRPLLDRAGLPAATHEAISAALEVVREHGFIDDGATKVRLQRRMVERALTACAARETRFEEQPLLVLLRRFSLEACRDEARSERERHAA